MSRPGQRRAICGCVAVAVLLLACRPTADDASAPATEIPTAERPNIVLYVVDTLRADALASYGNAIVETPVIDALARSGTVFPYARSTSSWTRASVASLFTGLYPDAHGTQTRADGLSPEVPVLPQLLAQHGYAVGAVVTNPNLGSFYGFARGFDHFRELYERTTRGVVSTEELMARADDATSHAIEWIDSVPEPFFLFVLSVDPHDPYDPPPAFDRYGDGYRGSADGTFHTLFQRSDLSEEDHARVRSLYWGEIAFLDHALGPLLWHLEAKGLDRRTAVILTSDHGEEFWEHGWAGHGHALFEELLRVPLIVRLPGDRALDPEARGQVEGVDVFPTLLEIARIPVPDGIDGTSLFATPAEPDVTAYASLFLGARALRAIVQWPWKLVRDVRSGDESLYHLERDAGEQQDLSREFPEVASRLRQEMGAIARSGARRRPYVPQRPDAELPARERALLEELGYIDTGPDRAEGD